jgi:hypothetical protein
MDFTDFYTYNSKCVICNADLMLDAELLCFIDMNDAYRPGVCGITYTFCDIHKRFEKADFFFTKNHKTASKRIFEQAINTFTVNKRFYPHFGKSKMETGIKQGHSIVSMELTYYKHCVNLPFDNKHSDYHEYRYHSGVLFNTASVASTDELYIEYESAYKHGYNIENTFFDNASYTTSVYSTDKKKHLEFISIPMSKWDFANKTILEGQIDKYSVLK